MKLFKLTLAIAIAACLLAATTVQATDRYSTGSGNWFNAATWNTQANGLGDPGIPQADDDVFVQNTHTIVVDDETNSVDTVTVESGGLLRLVSSDNSTPGILIVQESVTVSGSTGFVFDEDSFTATPTLRSVAANTALSGEFKISGDTGGSFAQQGGGSFHLTTGLIATQPGAGPVSISTFMENDGTIEAIGGPVQISGSFENDGSIRSSGANVLISGVTDNDGTIEAVTGTVTISAALQNNASGIVRANGAALLCSADVHNDGTISAQNGTDVTFSGTINSGSAGMFQVTAADSDMTFNMSGSASLSGADFNVEAGRMYFAQTLSTDGGYRQIGGQLEVAAGKSFQASGTYN